MKTSHRVFIYETFEDFGKLEEICSSIPFYFSDIYDIEKSFGKHSKYATISKQIIFLIIQRSKSLATDILRNLDILEENKIVKTADLQILVQDLLGIIKNIESDYRNGNYNGILKKIKILAEKCSDINQKFKRKV